MSTVPLKTTPLLEAAKTSAGRLTIIGFVLAFLGMIAIGCPRVVGTWVSILVAVLLVASGLGQALFALKSESGVKRVALVLLAALSVVCGVLMISRPLFGATFMTILLAVYFLRHFP